MSKRDKDALDFEAQKAQEAKEAKKKLRQAEKAGPESEKKAKKSGSKNSKKAARWLRDFRGEIKKIVWPDFKTVMKNTGIVLVTVVIIGALVWIVDFALTQSVNAMKNAASGVSETADYEEPPVFDEEIPGEPGAEEQGLDGYGEDYANGLEAEASAEPAAEAEPAAAPEE